MRFKISPFLQNLNEKACSKPHRNIEAL